ncbi:MAG: condensation domain-containing protein, partial [Planctomycetota bacterium]|nr:condensation domain-containing protein [Planctomycetota bacterium]
HLICAGEALPHSLAAEVLGRWQAVGSGAQLHNLYGPTEAAIDATWETVGLDPGGRSSVPIGRPIHGAAAVVVDGGLQPVPVGVAGELLIGGAGLALGYLDGPGFAGRTEAAFVELELGGRRRRWYRTGDRVRRLADGRFEALGRADGQVKVRGHRIELGEVEASLLASQAVTAAAVVAHTDTHSGTRLVAFVVGGPPSDELLARLPDTMRPARWVQLDALPLTTSEKVDRRRLSELAALELGSSPRTGRSPGTPTEDLLATELARLLDVAAVPVDADFFALGGHSLLATRLLAFAREAKGAAPPLRRFLAQPTVAALAREVDALAATPAAAAGPADATGPTPPSRAQERLWILHQRQPGSTYNMPGALRLCGPLDATALSSAVDALVARQRVLLTNFVPTPAGAPFPVQVVERSAPPRLELVEARPGTDPARLFERELAAEDARVFDLEVDPLLVLRLFRLAPDEHLLVFNLHHILGDGWSLGVFGAELGALYEQHLRSTRSGGAGRPREALPPLETSFADLARRERAESSEDPGTTLALVAWRQHLAGCPALDAPLDLPAARPPGPPSGRGAELVRRLPAALAADLGELARREALGLHGLLLATWGLLLARLCGAEDLCVGMAVARRDAPGAEALVGFFVSALPVRLDLSGGPGLAELARRTSAARSFALDHAEVGLDELVAHLADAGELVLDPRTTPLFQAGFDHAPVEAPLLNLEGLEVEQVEHHPGSAKLELGLRVEQTGADLCLRLEYATDLFEERVLVAWLDAWECLVTAGLADPGRDVWDLPLVATDHTALQLHGSTGPALPPGRLPTPPGRWLELVAAEPGSEALVHAGRRVSRGELHDLARAAATQVAAVSEPGPVALLLPRSIEQV